MLEERLKYLSFLFIENITRLLSCKESIKEHAIKNIAGKVLQRYIIYLLFNCRFLYLVIVTLRILTSCDLFSFS